MAPGKDSSPEALKVWTSERKPVGDLPAPQLLEFIQVGGGGIFPLSSHFYDAPYRTRQSSLLWCLGGTLSTLLQPFSSLCWTQEGRTAYVVKHRLQTLSLLREIPRVLCIHDNRECLQWVLINKKHGNYYTQKRNNKCRCSLDFMNTFQFQFKHLS